MGAKLYVGNLSFQTTEDALRDAFAQGGRTVKSVQIMLDRETGRSRGFAFVEMSSPAEAQAAIDELDGQQIDGRPLRVNEAREKTEGGPRGGGGGFSGGGHGGGHAGHGGGGGRGFGGGGERGERRERW